MLTFIIMNMKQITEASTLELIEIVLNEERNNGCADRAKLTNINRVLLSREGKTINQLMEIQRV